MYELIHSNDNRVLDRLRGLLDEYRLYAGDGKDEEQRLFGLIVEFIGERVAEERKRLMPFEPSK